MPYQTVDDITVRIHYDSSDFTTKTDTEFDTLIETLEKESRGLIESYMGDVTFSKETDLTQTFVSPDSATIPLDYPIDTVNEVQYKRKISGNFETLSSDRYTNTDHRLVLRRYPEMFYQRKGYERMNRLLRNTSRLSWSDFCEELKVDYDRGFDNIPNDVLNIQIRMINRMLRQLKMEQGVSTMDPENFEAITQANIVMTDDIKSDLDSITGFKNFIRSI